MTCTNDLKNLNQYITLRVITHKMTHNYYFLLKNSIQHLRQWKTRMCTVDFLKKVSHLLLSAFGSHIIEKGKKVHHVLSAGNRFLLLRSSKDAKKPIKQRN